MPQYQGIWTLQDAARLQSTQQWATDPLFENTTLLLQADNAPNGAQNNTFIDSSSNNFTITRNGNTTQGTFTPYSLQPGAWSNYFDGNGDYINTPPNAAFNFGTGDFTIEFWYYPNSISGAKTLIEVNYGTAPNFIMQPFSGVMNFYTNGISAFVISNVTDTIGNWYHYAAVRNGSTITLYRNGISVGTTTYSGNVGNSSAACFVGGSLGGGGYYIDGYLSNVRVVKGTAVYTSNFTPSQIPLTAITNTSLLTCQSNRFVDNSTNNFAITRNGNVSVQAFSPFAPQYQWTAPVIGGSAYFDGTGDYLNLAVQSFTGDFTVEAWIYPTRLNDSGGSGQIFSYDVINIQFSTDSAGNLNYYNNSITTSATAAISLNSWQHVALCRSGSTTRIFVNGTLRATNASDSGTRAFSAIGQFASGGAYLFQGYMSSVRWAATAVYTSNFTPPTAPLTAITNTQLLLNFTNAGIVDGTMKNNLETVGNAQVNTSIVKYGTGSMAFDGSGDYLVVGNMATTPNLALGSGDFTIEYWYYPLNTNIHASLNNLDDSAGTGSLWILMNGTFSGGSKVQFGYNTGSISNILFGTGTFATNQWYHIAITRQGSAMRCFINGVQEGATNTGIGSGSIQSFNRNLVIGATLSSGTYSVYNLNGYLDDFRITKGIARYTANFTPPTVALPRQ